MSFFTSQKQEYTSVKIDVAVETKDIEGNKTSSPGPRLRDPIAIERHDVAEFADTQNFTPYIFANLASNFLTYFPPRNLIESGLKLFAFFEFNFKTLDALDPSSAPLNEDH